jgi:hypothetical protein
MFRFKMSIYYLFGNICTPINSPREQIARMGMELIMFLNGSFEHLNVAKWVFEIDWCQKWS